MTHHRLSKCRFAADIHMRCFPGWWKIIPCVKLRISERVESWNHQLEAVGKSYFLPSPNSWGYHFQKILEGDAQPWLTPGTFTKLLVMDSHRTSFMDQAADPPFCKVLGSPASMTWAKRLRVPSRRSEAAAQCFFETLQSGGRLEFTLPGKRCIGAGPNFVATDPPKYEVQEDGKHNNCAWESTTWRYCAICPKVI